MSWGGPMPQISDERIAEIKEYFKQGTDTRDVDRLNKRVSELLRENAALRKKLSTGFHFTAEEMKAFEKMIREDEFKRKEKVLEEEMWKLRDQHVAEVEDYFAKLRQFLIADSPQEQFINWTSLYLQFLVETMDKDFGWKMPPNRNYGNKNYRISRLIESLMRKCNEISEDDEMDIRIAAEKAAETYKIYFMPTEE